VVVLAVGSAGAVKGWDRWQSRCSAQSAKTPDKALRSVEATPVAQLDLSRLDPSHTIDPNAVRGVLASARKPGGGFQPVSRVLVADAAKQDKDSMVSIEDAVQPVGMVNGNPVLAVMGSWLGGTSGSLVVMNRTSGSLQWGRQFSGGGAHARHLPGRLILLQQSPRPMAAAFAVDDGSLQWCTWLGDEAPTSYDPTFTSAVSADGGLYVVHEPSEESVGRSVRLVRVDASTGVVGWEQPVSGVDRVSRVDVLGGQVLISRPDPRMYIRARWELLQRDPKAGMLMARSAANGKPSWTYAGPDRSRWAVNVIGTRGETAVVAARRVTAEPVSEGITEEALNRSWLVGLDSGGKEVWRQDLGTALVYDLSKQAKLAGNVVITQESKTGQPVRLVAHDIATGKVRWTRVTSRTVPLIDLSTSTVVDNHLIVAGSGKRGGLRSIDLATGVEEPVLTDGNIRYVVGNGTAITVAADGLLFTLERK
jgi:outer membrane protein assembly factor BamB